MDHFPHTPPGNNPFRRYFAGGYASGCGAALGCLGTLILIWITLNVILPIFLIGGCIALLSKQYTDSNPAPIEVDTLHSLPSPNGGLLSIRRQFKRSYLTWAEIRWTGTRVDSRKKPTYHYNVSLGIYNNRWRQNNPGIQVAAWNLTRSKTRTTNVAHTPSDNLKRRERRVFDASIATAFPIAYISFGELPKGR